MKRLHRRDFLAGLAGAIALPATWPTGAYAQQLRSVEPLLLGTHQRGAGAQGARRPWSLPELADNGNAVLLKVSVESPMSATDHVKRIHLISNRNPVAEMATFLSGAA